MDRMAEILDEPVTLDEDPAAADLPRLAGSVSLEQVSFGYGTGRAIVQDLDLEIRSGSSVAIVGPSGAGKSTVTSLLLRFWDPDQGRVLFDGVDIRRATLRSLRDQIGIVFQDTFILDTTLRENIRVGRLGASDEEIAAAAHGAQLDSFLESLPQGFDTVLGERGTRMSGGQRQRIAIARVILRDPALLILDEATSALDPHTEKEILETLAHVSRGRTTISITHRLAIAAAASLIYVMDRGTVVEKGSHAELMALGGLYRRLYLEQSGGERTTDLNAARLSRVGLFRGLSPAVLESIAQRLHLHRFGADEPVVRQGETGDRMYLVMSGRLEVAVEDPLGPRRVAVLSEGDHFGEMALLTGEPRTATVRTIEGCELLALSIRDFNDLISRDPTLKAAVDDLARQRRAALDRIVAGAPSS
jgi:ATP-binding cassette subfamily B protein